MVLRTGALAIGAALFASSVAFAPSLARAQDEVGDAGIVVDWRVTDDVGTEFEVEATVHNQTTASYSEWSIKVPFRHTITQVEGAVSVQDDSSVVITGTQLLPPGGELTIGMSVNSTGPVSRIPSSCVATDTSCRIVVPWDSLSGGAPNETGLQQVAPDGADTGDSPGQPVEASPSPQPGSSRDPSDEPRQQKLTISVVTTSDWGTGQSVGVIVRNEGPDTINEWAVAIPWEVAVDSMWNAQSTSGGNTVRATGKTWEGDSSQMEPGQAIQFGFTASPGASTVPDGSCSAHTDAGPTECVLAR